MTDPTDKSTDEEGLLLLTRNNVKYKYPGYGLEQVALLLRLLDARDARIATLERFYADEKTIRERAEGEADEASMRIAELERDVRRHYDNATQMGKEADAAEAALADARRRNEQHVIAYDELARSSAATIARLARQQIELEAGRRTIERAHAHLTAALMPPPGETVKFIDRVNAAYLLLRGEEGSTG